MSDAVMWTLIGIAVVAVVVIVVMLWQARRHRARTEHLHDRFGPEYDRVGGAADSRRDRRSAESELADRAEQRDELEIRPLGAGARERYAARWHETQATFVDAPAPALEQAESLLVQVMTDRGYPVDHFEERAALISVDHPELVENYRQAHSTRDRVREGNADTETMRTAMLRYRSLFDELLAPDDAPVA